MTRFVAIIFLSLVLVEMARSSHLEILSTIRHSSTLSQHKRTKRWTSSNPQSLIALATLADLESGSGFRMINNMHIDNAKGGKRARLIQTYAGYDVFGSSVEAELNIKGYFSGQMYGLVVRNLEKDIPNPNVCTRNVSYLQNKVVRLERLNPDISNIQFTNVTRLIYPDSRQKRARMAYKIEMLYDDERAVSLPVYMFDACTGSVIQHYNGIGSYKNRESIPLRQNNKQYTNQRTQGQGQSLTLASSSCNVSVPGVGGNAKTGLNTYNIPPLCLNVEMVNDTLCQMLGEYSYVVDNLYARSYNKFDSIIFDCTEGYQDEINGAYGVANDVFYFAEMFGHFLKDKYNFKISNEPLRYVVHFGDLYANAFYISGSGSFFLGDGSYIYFYPFSGLDTIAHETAHAITYIYSGLPYLEMTGGMNEAFSDITAEVFKHFMNGSNNWVHGWDIFKKNGGLRFFDDPTVDGKSIKYRFKYRYGMNVHYSSGLFNHAFYRLVKKEGMNIYDAYKCFLDANLFLWSPFSDFRTAACHVMQACYDNGFNHRKVRRAFFHVGIPLFSCRYSAMTTSLFVGETLKSILVSKTRSPIFKAELSLTSKETFEVQASSESTPVRIDVGRDDEVEKVIVTGIDQVNIDKGYSYVYIKLSTDTDSDVRVTLSVSP